MSRGQMLGILGKGCWGQSSQTRTKKECRNADDLMWWSLTAASKRSRRRSHVSSGLDRQDRLDSVFDKVECIHELKMQFSFPYYYIDIKRICKNNFNKIDQTMWNCVCVSHKHLFLFSIFFSKQVEKIIKKNSTSTSDTILPKLCAPLTIPRIIYSVVYSLILVNPSFLPRRLYFWCSLFVCIRRTGSCDIH